MLKQYAGIIFLSFVTFVTQAQNTQHLSLNDAIAGAVKNNRRLQISSTETAIAKESYASTKAIFLPQLQLSYTGFSTDNPLNTFGFKLQQQVVTMEDFNPDKLNHPSSSTNFTTQLNLEQPLLNADLMNMRKAAYKQAEATSFSEKRTKEYVEFQVKQLYLTLQFKYEEKKVSKMSVDLLKAIYKFTKDYFDQGLVQKSDLLNVEVQLKGAEASLTGNVNEIASLSDQLSLVTGHESGIVYSVDSLSSAITAIGSFSDNRTDLLAMKAGLQAIQYSLKGTKASRLPRINAFANYQLNDKNAFGFGGKGYLAGIQLSWTIYKGNTVTHKINSLQQEETKMQLLIDQQKAEANTDILVTSRKRDDAMQRAAQYRSAVAAADEAFRVLQNRYRQGLVHTTDVLAAQTQLSGQQLALAGANFMQQMAEAYLQFLTGNHQ